MKQAADAFLKKPNFHRKLRNEILFGLVPTTLRNNSVQTQSINYVRSLMLYGGFLRHGIKSLASVIKFGEFINEDLDFKCHQEKIDEFFFSRK